MLPDPAEARAVAAAEPALARRALRRWLREAGGTGHPPSLAEVDRTLAVAAGAAVETSWRGADGCAVRAAGSGSSRDDAPVVSRR